MDRMIALGRNVSAAHSSTEQESTVARSRREQQDSPLPESISGDDSENVERSNDSLRDSTRSSSIATVSTVVRAASPTISELEIGNNTTIQTIHEQPPQTDFSDSQSEDSSRSATPSPGPRNLNSNTYHSTSRSASLFLDSSSTSSGSYDEDGIDALELLTLTEDLDADAEDMSVGEEHSLDPVEEVDERDDSFDAAAERLLVAAQRISSSVYSISSSSSNDEDTRNNSTSVSQHGDVLSPLSSRNISSRITTTPSRSGIPRASTPRTPNQGSNRNIARQSPAHGRFSTERSQSPRVTQSPNLRDDSSIRGLRDRVLRSGARSRLPLPFSTSASGTMHGHPQRSDYGASVFNTIRSSFRTPDPIYRPGSVSRDGDRNSISRQSGTGSTSSYQRPTRSSEAKAAAATPKTPAKAGRLPINTPSKSLNKRPAWR
ncbi:hypothetical protein DFH27DRAFT_379913 [Peziza echinospora]|nr:hypothetical protein DFH27DRAFT_379913 [Peziza echinospora]